MSPARGGSATVRVTRSRRLGAVTRFRRPLVRITALSRPDNSA